MDPRLKKPMPPQLMLPLSSQHLQNLPLRDRSEAIALLARLLLEAAGWNEVNDDDA
jgi:DNA-binding NtrC family response regulator